ncbi:MAG TPA: hypothetical protein VFA12_20365 [Stellaceae bacterium]|nr:hypothetical protein [Stellaceae bacterium]
MPSRSEVVRAAPAGSHVLALSGGEYLVTHPDRPAYIVGAFGDVRYIKNAAAEVEPRRE